MSKDEDGPQHADNPTSPSSRNTSHISLSIYASSLDVTSPTPPERSVIEEM